LDSQSRDRFISLYARLIVDELRLRLAIEDDPKLVSTADIRFLLQTAAMLALESPTDLTIEAVNEREWAYDVITRLAEAYSQPYDGVPSAVEFVLARLGNFPARDLLRNQNISHQSDVVLKSPGLMLESLAREPEKTVDFTGLGSRVLTDFQVRLVGAMNASRAVSVSAPTSAGKSFVLNHHIVATLSSTVGSQIVYLVPTRALIYQVTTDLLGLLRTAKRREVIVSAAPIVFTKQEAARGVVYVLTQERLMTLFGTPEFTAHIDALYVDEAQEIGDTERGLILDSAIREFVKRFPTARICFASPLTNNPAFLFDEFDVRENVTAFREPFSPVAQLVIQVSAIKGQTQAAEVSVRTPHGNQVVGEVRLPFTFRGVVSRLAQMAIFVRKPEDTVIVFANRPSDAVEIAEKIADAIATKTNDSEVLELVDFVRAHVHPRYALADVLLKGVAFHYGRMPHIIRHRVEELLRSKKLQYVVSTSTLLQGVNLPARHIVVLAPRQGNDNPMDSSDFWNLVGRAGRLRQNFRGLVWCLDPDAWPNKPLEGERLAQIKSAFRTSLESEDVREAAQAVLTNAAPLQMVQGRARVEQFLGKAFCEFTLNERKLSESRRAAEPFRASLLAIDNSLQELKQRLRVPPQVCVRNSVVAPMLLEDLWDRLALGVSPQMFPVDPFQQGAIGHFRAIFEIIDDVFIGSTKQSWKYFASLAYFWVTGSSLKDLIDNRLTFYKVNPEKRAINRNIRELLDAIEQTLRFTYVKYMKAYCDVLRAFLEHSGRAEDAQRITPWDLYIEMGARDRVVLTLMSMGISRTTAILIRRAITNRTEIDREACWKRLEELPLRVLAIPEVCKREIQQLTTGG
jgi:superfamily II DNA/RNA helicase